MVRAVLGSGRLIAITGPSGVGETVFVDRLQDEIASEMEVTLRYAHLAEGGHRGRGGAGRRGESPNDSAQVPAPGEAPRPTIDRATIDR